MKSLAVAAFVSLVSGIFFSLGVLAIVLLADGWNGRTGPFEEQAEIVRLPPDLNIVEHSRTSGTPYFTVRGFVENAGSTEWVEVTIKARILASEAEVNTCETRLDGAFSPGSRRAFQVECYGVAGSNTPENLRYDLTVANAYRAGG